MFSIATVPHALFAQHVTHPARQDEISADTGRMLPGRRDFSRYTPGMCDAAVWNIRALVWRQGERDTLSYTAAVRDTLPTAALVAAQQCGDHHTIADVRPVPPGFLAFLRLALDMNKDTAAQATITRALSVATTPSERANFLLAAEQAYFAARPVRVTRAETVLARLDSLGDTPGVLLPRFQGHYLFVEYWRKLFDATHLRGAIDTTLQLGALLAPEAVSNEIGSERLDLFAKLLELEVSERGDTALHSSSVLQRAATGLEGAGMIMEMAERRIRFYGQLYHPPDSAVWYSQNTVPANGTHLIPGHLSLAVSVEQNCGDRCHPIYALLRRLHAIYGTRLDIVLLTKTAGYSPGSGPQTPEQEAEAIRQYYLEYLHLPVATLAVESTPYHRLPDGRRVNERTSYEARYGWAGIFPGSWVTPNVVLIDQQGKIQWMSSLNWADTSIGDTQLMLSSYMSRLSAQTQ